MKQKTHPGQGGREGGCFDIGELGGLAQGREGQHGEDEDLSPFGDLLGVHDEDGINHRCLPVRLLRYHQRVCQGDPGGLNIYNSLYSNRMVRFASTTIQV